MVRLKQTVTITIAYAPEEQSAPAQWDWEVLLDVGGGCEIKELAFSDTSLVEEK